MKRKMFILLFSVIFISVGYSQCPKAEMYKKKSKEAFNDGNKAMRNNPTLVGANYSSNQMGAPDAYIILSAYEAYVCQCKNQNNGEEAERLKNFINKEYVQRYASMVSKYGSMPKVTSCKGGEGEEKAEASEEKNKEKATPLESDKKANNKEAINKVAKEMRLREDEVEILNIFNNSKNINEAWSKLNAKGIKNLNKYTLEAIEKLLATNPNFSINASELQSLKEGNSFNEILKNYNFKQSNKIAQQLGLNYQQTELLNIVATSNNKEEMMKRINQKGMQNISDKATQGIQKLLGDSYGSLPITSGDITNILQGNYTGAVENIVKNQQINAVSKGLGLSKNSSALIVNAVSEIASQLERTPEERESRRQERIRKWEKKNISYKTFSDSDGIHSVNFDRINNLKIVTTVSREGKLVKSEQYDMENNELVILTEPISFYNNRLPKESKETNFKEKTQFVNTYEYEGVFPKIIKKEDKLTGAIVYDKSKSSFQDIKNKDGKVIGSREIFDGIIVEESIKLNNEKIKTVFDENGDKQKVFYYSIKNKLSRRERKMLEKNPQLAKMFLERINREKAYSQNGTLKYVIDYSYKGKGMIGNVEKKVTLYKNNEPFEVKIINAKGKIITQ